MTRVSALRHQEALEMQIARCVLRGDIVAARSIAVDLAAFRDGQLTNDEFDAAVSA